jgi:thiazole synthase
MTNPQSPIPNPFADPLVIAGREFASRLIVGTGKYSSFAVMQRAHEASGADMVTVAVRRINISDRTKESLLDYIDTDKIALLPNTAGCYSAEDAVRTARLGREAGLSNWVKLEVIGDERTLFPDNEELIVATKILVKEGFVVLPYTTDDPIVCRKLEDAGAAAVMPLGAPHRAPAWAFKTPTTSASSASFRACPSSSTPVWEPRPTPPSRWSWARTVCS